MELHDPAIVRDELLAQRPPSLDELQGGQYPHFDVLHSYLLSSDVEQRRQWAECLRLLIAHRAPTDYADLVAVALICWKNWEPLPELTAELVSLYIEAGYIDLVSPMTGQLRPPKPQGSPRRWSSDEGMTPLASAICWGNHHAARLFIAHGASLELGPVEQGGESMDAVTWASYFDHAQTKAVVQEEAMRLKVRASVAEPSVSPSPVRRRAVV